MSYVIAAPAALANVATDIAGIGSTLSAANANAVAPTSGLAAAAADEVSGALASFFSTYAQEYRALSTEAASFHAQFVQALTTGAGWYAGAEAANASPLQSVEQAALSLVNAPTEALVGRPLVGDGANAKTPGGRGQDGGLLYGSGGNGAAGKAGQAGGAGGNAGWFGNGGAGGAGGAGASGGSGGAGGLVSGNGGAGGLGGAASADFNGGNPGLGGAGGAAGMFGQAGVHGQTGSPSSTGTGTGGGGDTGTGTGGGGDTGTGTGTGTGGGGDTGTGGGGGGGGDTGTGGGGASGLTASYATTSQWNNGFNAEYTITNSGTTPVTNWQLQFDLPANESVTSPWNGQVTQTGTHYSVTPLSYDTTIAPGTSIKIGFQGAQTGSYSAPTNLQITGQPGTGGTGTGGGGTGTGGGGTGTGGGGTGTGGGTNPTGTVISQQYGTTTLDGKYIVQNNAWNNGGNQAITVTDNGFVITTENGSAPTNGAPLGYPSIYDGVHYGTFSPGTNLPIQVGTITSATSSITYNYPTTGVYDASYDIWLNPTPITTGVNQQEVMIWFNHTGSIQPVGSPTGTTNIDGQNFTVWKGSNGQNQVVSYVSNTPITTWNNFDLMGFIDNTQTIEPVTDSWYLTSVQAGYEPWSGTVGAGVSNFDVTVNGV